MANNTEKRLRAVFEVDSTGFNDGLKGVNRSLRNAKSELKLASEGIKAFGSDSNRLKSVQESLAKQVELHSKKVDIYKQSIDKTTSKMKDNIKARDELKNSLDKANRKYEEAVKLYGKESTEAQKAKKEVDNLTEEYKKKEKAVKSNARSIQNYETNMNKANTQVVKTKAELEKINNELDKSNNKWLKASEGLQKHSDRLRSIGGKISDVGKSLTTKVSVPLAGVGIAASKVGMDFEAEMSKVQAISGATGEDFKKLKAKAEEMGAKTKFSATESAKALEYMAMAGWKTQDMLDGLPPILNLAIASGEQLGTTSDIVTDALTAFGLKAKDAGMFSDVLAAASSNANTNVGMMGATFQYVAPVAGALGYSVQDTAIAIGLMANAGIKADKAGTAIRTGLTNLVKPTDSMADAMKKYGITVKDANGKMKPFRQVIGELRQKLGNLDKATQANVASTIFGKEAMSGWLSIINASKDDVNKLTNAIDTSEGATDKMAKTMGNNAKGSITEMKSALEGAGIKIFEVVAPSITNLAKEVTKMADKFSKLNPKTQETIVKLAALGIATGPVIGGIGKTISGVGSLAGGLSKLTGFLGKATTATKGATTATGLATKGMSAMGLATKASTLLLNPWTLAIAGVGIAGYATYKHLKKEAIPAVDLFADKVEHSTKKVKKANGEVENSVTKTTTKISQGTKKAVGSYMKLDENAKKHLMNLYINGTKITKNTANGIVKTYKDMGTQIKDGIDKDHKEQMKKMQEFFAKTQTITKEEQREMFTSLQEHNNKQKAEIDKYEKEIQAILDKASKEKRELKADEMQKIDEIQEKMKVNAVKTLSEEEVESKVILERLKAHSERLTTEQASEVIKNAEKQRQGAVEKAEKQYDETVANIIRMRDETGAITKEQADKMIKEAERQKRESITKAGQMKETVVEKIREMNRDTLKNIDENDGHIKTKWENLKSWFKNNPILRNIKTVMQNSQDELAGHNWTGTNYWQGGLTYLHDSPGINSNYELYDLPRGTRIYNHDASADLVTKTAENVATKVANSVLKNFGNIGAVGQEQTIIVPVNIDGREVARVTAKPMSEELGKLNKRGGLGYV